MGRKPTLKHSIDRINSNGDYEPGNCRWATALEQSHNRRSNRWIEFGGQKMILKQWADYLNTTSVNLSTMMKSKPFDKVVDYYQNHRRKSPSR